MAASYTRPVPQAAKKAEPPKSIYAGINTDVLRDPMLDPGKYRLRVLSAEERVNPQDEAKRTVITHFEVAETYEGNMKPGAKGATVFAVTGSKAAPYNRARLKAQMAACVGIELFQYDEFDPDGMFLEACLGYSNDRSVEIESAFLGREVLVTVTLGSPCKDKDGKLTGDHFREYAWEPVE